MSDKFPAADVHSPFNACCYRDQCRANAEALASQPAPSADRMAIKMLVAAGFVTEAKANEALQIAHGFERGPLEPAPSAAQGAVAWCAEFDDGWREYAGDGDPEVKEWPTWRQKPVSIRPLIYGDTPPASVEVPEGMVAVHESKLRHFVRELNGARQGDNPQARAEYVHGALTALLAAAKQENSHE